jgi:hypothetical protein
MTTPAWVMLVTTWSVIIFFTVRFFLAVLRTPPAEAKPEAGSEGPK